MICIYNPKLTFFELLMRIPAPRARTDAAAANAAAATMHTRNKQKGEDAIQGIIRLAVKASSGFDAFAKGSGYGFFSLDAFCQGFRFC